MSAGDHYIDVKYSKDDASAANNDTLQFKVAITLTDTPPVYYGYTISNVQGDHIILVALAATDKLFTKLGNSWIQVTKAYKKVNGSWVEQSDLTTVFESGINYVKGN